MTQSMTQDVQAQGVEMMNGHRSSPDLSVIIPVHNAAATIVSVVSSFVAIEGINVEVLVVDDASTDDSVALVEGLARPEVRVLSLPYNQGAGVARNMGFARARGRYTIFFDADDEVEQSALVEAIRVLDVTSADLAMLSYRYRRDETGENVDMNSHDRAVWSEYATEAVRVARLSEVPRLLGFSNYPWNKVLRTEHYRAAGLRFSSTPVHNDILGHWITLLSVQTLVLIDQPLCLHVVVDGAANLTNRSSRARLALFDALEDTYSMLESHPDLRNRYSHHYWDFVLRVCGWAAPRLDADLTDEFNLQLQRHLLRMNLADYARIRQRRDPGLASRIVRRATQ